MRKYVTITFCLLAGCHAIFNSTDKLYKISLGMSKQEVVGVMGKPSSLSAKENTEYLLYYLHEPNHPFGKEYIPYYIRLISGKVESYGRVGDFDSTKTPTQQIEQKIDLNIHEK